MTEYEDNKQKVQEYRQRNKDKGSKLIELLCKVMEWFNEHCIKN